MDVVTRRFDSGPDGDGGFVVVAHDIQDRIDAEVRLLRLARAERGHAQELASIVASVEDGVAVVDGNDRIVVRNDRLAAMFGRESRPEPRRQRLAGVPDDDAIRTSDDRWLRISERTIGSEAPRTLVLVRDLTPSGSGRPPRTSSSASCPPAPHTDDDDLGLAHVLRRSLTKVDPSMVDLAGDVAAEAQRLTELIDDLLVLSRGQADRLVVDPEPVHVLGVVRDVVRLEAARFPHSGSRSIRQTDSRPRRPI